MADNDLIERLRLEAQIHAQEARTANATIAEIYQLCSGGKGEPGNWHGAEPVRALIAERDALAATLRQQAFSQFANPEALADWLDALHECHADGSVGNRKWEAAQVAARAIRSLNEPSGNSGQLRQQAGMVDEGMVREARDLIDRMDDSTFIADKTLRAVLALAALAQQGGAVAELWIGSPSSEGTTAYGFDRLPLMCDLPPGKYPLYLHAERARVPDALRHAAKVIELYDDALGGSCEMATSTDCAEVLTALAGYYNLPASPTPDKEG